MSLYLRFLRYARPYWLLALVASLCFAASGFLGAYPIQLFKRAVDVAMSRALGDVGAVAGGFMGPLTRLAGELTQLGWSLYFLLRIDPRLTLLSLAVAPPLGYAVYRYGNTMRGLAGQFRVAQSRLWSFLAENIASIRECKIFTREAHELERFRGHTQALNRLGLQDSVLNATLTFLTGLLFSAGETVVLLLGGLSVYGGGMTPGNLAAFLMYLRLLYNR